MLSQLVSTLLNQTLPKERYEILVVSDGSTDGTVEWLEALRGEHPNLICLSQRNRGPAAARNLGAKSARGAYLVFTDDDCTATPDWLERVLEAFQRSDAVAVQGYTSTNTRAMTPLTRQVENMTFDPSMPTCNAAFLREAFQRVGGFDESFPFPHNEDTDLAWRVGKLGPIVFAADARVIHPPREESVFQRASWVRYLESEFLLYAKHPEKYRAVCGGTPWRIIYRNVFLHAQAHNLKQSMRYLIKPFQPRLFLRCVGLVIVRWFNLCRFSYRYFRASRRYQRRSSVESGAPNAAQA